MTRPTEFSSVERVGWKVIKIICGRVNVPDKLIINLIFSLRAANIPMGETNFKMVTLEKSCQSTAQYRRWKEREIGGVFTQPADRFAGKRSVCNNISVKFPKK
jgi:hypothetical protein